jgi:hypothetical protein
VIHKVKPKAHKNHDEIRILKDEEDKPCGSVEDVMKVVADLDFAPSCVDMGWEFEVEEIFVRADNGFGEAFDPAGYRVRTTFQRPDRESGEMKRGYGRWWEVPLNVSESGVAFTVYAMAELILTHELKESIKWRGARFFDPHHSLRELASIQAGRYTRSIP